MFDRLERALFPPKRPLLPAPSPPSTSPAAAERAEDGAPRARRAGVATPPKERSALLDAFAGSVLTPREFAEAHDLLPATFQNWLAQRRRLPEALVALRAPPHARGAPRVH